MREAKSAVLTAIGFCGPGRGGSGFRRGSSYSRWFSGTMNSTNYYEVRVSGKSLVLTKGKAAIGEIVGSVVLTFGFGDTQYFLGVPQAHVVSLSMPLRARLLVLMLCMVLPGWESGWPGTLCYLPTRLLRVLSYATATNLQISYKFSASPTLIQHTLH